MMGRKAYKLWILVLIITIVLGILSLKGTVKVDLENKEGYENQAEIDPNNNLLSEITQDFGNFCAITKDFVGTVFQGKDSQYESGINALTGKETIQKENEEAVTAGSENVSKEEIVEAINEKKESILSALAEKSEFSETSQNVTITSATVLYVTDGDTLHVDIGGNDLKVRLIGIDTPESVHSDSSKNTVWGTYASDYTKSLLEEGQTVYLEYDVGIEDKYGRTLAYVWLKEDTSDIMNMLNAKLLADGYAVDKEYKPNRKYTQQFHEIRVNAENSNTGLWKEEGFRKLWEE